NCTTSDSQLGRRFGLLVNDGAVVSADDVSVCIGVVVVSVGYVYGGGVVLVPVPVFVPVPVPLVVVPPSPTVIVPDIVVGCTWQMNLYVPAALNTCEFV